MAFIYFMDIQNLHIEIDDINTEHRNKPRTKKKQL